MAPRICYSYLRFSSKPQELGTSVERQNDSYSEFCRTNAYKPATDQFADLGKSGSYGRQKALKAFLALVEGGRIKIGSCLFIENIDRLSRMPPLISLEIVKKILDRGIDIATPRYSITRQDMLTNNPVMYRLQSDIERAFEESERKSEMGKKNWIIRKAKARTEKKPKFRGPSWLCRKDEEWKVIESKAQIVRQIYAWSLEGLGTMRIARLLKEKKIENIASDRSKKAIKYWNHTTIAKLLHDVAVIGDWQPMKTEKEYEPESGSFKKKFLRDGEVIKGYYPAIIDKKTFDSVQANISRHKRFSGNRKVCSNLFPSLVRDAATEQSYRYLRVAKPENALLMAENGLAWKYHEFEKAFLRFVREVQIGATGKVMISKAAALQDIADGIADNIAKLKTAIKKRYSETLDNAIAESEAELKKILADVAKEKESGSVEDVRTLAKLDCKDDSVRVRLKAAIATVVSVIWIQIEDQPDGTRRLVAQVDFRDGNKRWFENHRGRMQGRKPVEYSYVDAGTSQNPFPEE